MEGCTMNHKKQCGNCRFWMTQQCPPEKAGNKQSMSSRPCIDFQWKQYIMDEMQHPAVPDIRTKESPIIKWMEHQVLDNGCEIWEGVCPNGEKAQITSHWDGWKWIGVSISIYGAGHGIEQIWYENIDKAKDAIANHVRETFLNKLHKHWAEMSACMYMLGMDSPISVYQRHPRSNHLIPIDHETATKQELEERQ